MGLPSVVFNLLSVVISSVLQMARFNARRLLHLMKFPANLLLKYAAWDAMLVLVPGIMGLATGVRMRTDQNSGSYLQVVCYGLTSWPFYSPTLLLVWSVVAIFVGVFRVFLVRLHTKTNTKRYLYLLGLLVMLNICTGTATVMAGSKIRHGLAESALDQLDRLYGQHTLLYNTPLHEAWDVLQMQLSCCGVHGYQDYMGLTNAKRKQEPLPASCCTIWWRHEMPHVNNPEQCQLDAKLGVRDSVYIQMPDCLSQLTAWLKHYLYAQVLVMYLSVIAQSLAIVYTYFIYYRPTQSLGSGR